MGHDVGPGSDEHAGVADEAAQPADARRALARPLEAIGVVRLADDPWGGQVLEEVLPDGAPDVPDAPQKLFYRPKEPRPRFEQVSDQCALAVTRR